MEASSSCDVSAQEIQPSNQTMLSGIQGPILEPLEAFHHQILEPLEEDRHQQMIVCNICGGEYAFDNIGYKLTTCKHEFCKPCLAISVAERLLPLMQMSDILSINFNDNLSCPLELCHCALSRQDLRYAVGFDILHMLDLKVATMVTHKVFFPLLHLCPFCRSGSRCKRLRPYTHLHYLCFATLHKALLSNAISLDPNEKYTHTSLVQLLQQAAPSSFLCPHCCLLLCQHCGANLGPLNQNAPAHVCDPSLTQCFEFARSMLRLCSAYAQETYTPKTRIKKKSKARFSWLFPFFSRKPFRKQGTPSPSVVKSTLDLIYEGCLEKRFDGQGMAATEEEVKEDIEEYVDVHDRSRDEAVGCFTQIAKRYKEKPKLVVTKRQARRLNKQTQSALQELTSTIIQMLIDNHGVLPSLVVGLLCCHDLPYSLLKWLARNESLTHIIAHESLYHDLLSFLRALSSSWELLPLLCSSEVEEYDCWNVLQYGSQCETPGSIISDLEKILMQTRFMLRLIKPEPLSMNLAQDIEETYELLCKRVKVWEVAISQHQWLAVAAHHDGLIPNAKDLEKKKRILINKLKSLIPNDNPLISESNLMPSRPVIETYKAALRPLQFNEGSLFSSHYFRNAVTMSSQETMLNKKRTRAINKEITEFNGALPLEWDSSIFVRVDEQRLDVMRALIIGPKGTPYENGVFLFDLWLGTGYPDTPPKVRFLTTGGGTVRFHPSLYSDGKVCLSILGTGFGPEWKPGTSSILQVLVSLQALVLVQNPFYNEPRMFGVTLAPFQEDAVIYYKNQCKNTLQFSMLPALRFPDPLFLPIIHTHFRLKAPYILHQCTTWIEDESRPLVKASLLTFFDQLRLELDKLNGTTV